MALEAGPHVRLDSRAIAQLLRSEDGPNGRFMAELGTQVQERAKSKVGVSKGPLHGTTLVRGEEAHLRDTIVKRWVEDASGPAVLVGSDHPISYIHHEGTRPHVIRARRAKTLRFAVAGGSAVFSPGGGFLVFAKQVNHPGTAPNRYLTDALAELQLPIAA